MPVETRPVVVNADRLSVRYGTQVVLDQTSFTIHAGDRIALVGRNGAGKSTVLKLLGGVEEPDEGAIQWQRGLTTGYLPQDVTLDGSRTVEANILHGARHILAWRQRYETIDRKSVV